MEANATPQFIGALTEMVWTQIGSCSSRNSRGHYLYFANCWNSENVAQDLESFAKHAGRSTVTTDDVLLITRRNDALQEIMREFIESDKKQKKSVGKGR